MGRRPRFSREQVEDAALSVLDEYGMEGMTVRAVAAQLGTGAMTLYNYIETHADLAAMAVDATLREVDISDSPHPDWREDVRAISHAVWSAVRRHPNAIPLILARRSRSPVFLDIAEALLGALARSGRSGQDLLIAFRAVSTLATAFAQTEIAGALSTNHQTSTPDAVIEQFASLDVDRYPRLIEIARSAAISNPETEFLRSLDALIAGLGAQSSSSAVAP